MAITGSRQSSVLLVHEAEEILMVCRRKEHLREDLGRDEMGDRNDGSREAD